MDKEYKISNDKITVQTAIPFHSLMKMELHHDINAHVILVLRVTAEKESQEEILGRDWSGTSIYVYQNEEELLFAGSIEKLICRKGNQLLEMEIRGISGTAKLDRKRKRQSFQNPHMTYREVIQKGLRRNKGKMGNQRRSGDRQPDYPIR